MNIPEIMLTGLFMGIGAMAGLGFLGIIAVSIKAGMDYHKLKYPKKGLRKL